MPQDDLRTRLGREGLNSLLRDPRYLNADDPEHKRVVAMVARAFELVFDEAPANRRRLGQAEPDAFTRTLEQRVGDEAAERRLPRAERAGLGRELLVRALKQDGVKLPSHVPEREPPPPGPFPELSAPAARRRNTSARPPAKKPTKRRLTSTLLSDGEGRDDLAGDNGTDRIDRRRGAAQIAQGRPAGPPSLPPIPAYRAKTLLLQRQWEPWFNIVSQLGDLSSGERRAFMELFAAEGGANLHSSGAFAGIKPPALALAKEHEPGGLAGVAVPQQMSLEQLALAYRGFVTDVAERYGGRGALAKLTSDATVATVIDTFFFPGPQGGPKFIKDAVVDVTIELSRELEPSEFDNLGLEALPSDDSNPKATMRNLQRLDRNGFGPMFREAVTKLRLDHPITGNSRTRVSHFRFADEP